MAASVAVLLLGACGGAGQQSRGGQGSVSSVTMVGNTIKPPQLTNLWVLFMAQQGAAQRNGINISTQESGSSTNAMSAVQAGQADFSFMGVQTFWNAVSKNRDTGLRMIGAGIVDLPFDLVVNTDRVKTVADLQTANVAVAGLGTIAQYETVVLLKARGYDASGVHWYPTQNVPGEDSAVISNQADATMVLHTETARVLSQAHEHHTNLKVLVSSQELKKVAPLGGTIIVASAKALRQPDVVQRFVNTMIDADRQLYSTKGDYMDEAKRLQPGQSTDSQLQDLYGVFRPVFGVNGGLSRRVYEAVYQVWARYVNPNGAKSLSWADAEQLMNSQFADKYLKAHGAIGGVDDVPDWR